MLRNILIRFFVGIAVVLIGILILFIWSAVPLDPRFHFLPQSGQGLSVESWENSAKTFSLDDSALILYARWLKHVVTGNFGVAIEYQVEVAELIREHSLEFARLILSSWILGAIIGVTLAVVLNVNQIGLSRPLRQFFEPKNQQLAPVFFLAFLLIPLFGNALDTPFSRNTYGSHGLSFVPLVIALACLPASSFLQITRSALQDVDERDSDNQAGIFSVWLNHAFQNGWVPPITKSLLTLMIGSACVDWLFFGYFGQFFFSAVRSGDYNLFGGIAIVYGSAMVLAMLLLDTLYALYQLSIKLLNRRNRVA